MNSYRVPQGGMVSKVSMSKAVLILQVLGPQGSRDPGTMMRLQGFRRSPFIDLGFKGTKGPYVSGFGGIEVFPILSKAFKGFDVSKSEGFRV